MIKIVIINPGSTSTKVALFGGENGQMKEIVNQTLRHSEEELAPFRGQPMVSQEEYRSGLILDFLEKNQISFAEIDAVAGRGGFVPQKRFESGVYEINETMIDDLKKRSLSEHPANLGAILAVHLAHLVEQKCGKKIHSFVMDPVVVDEMIDIARPSGMKDIECKSYFHALNQKAVSRRYAKSIGRKYDELNLIVAHMGGGISISAHRKGKVIDTFNGMNGLGPFSPERSGGVDTRQLIDLCFSGKYTYQKLCLLNVGEGGLYAYLGTKDAREVVKMVAAGDPYARFIYESMAYQVAKGITWFLASFLPEDGLIDAILLTGGLAYDRQFLIPFITRRVEKAAPVHVFPGEDEMIALAEGALSAMEGEIPTRQYLGNPEQP